MTDPLQHEAAPHALWWREFQPTAEPVQPVWDEHELAAARSLVGDGAVGLRDLDSGHTKRRTLPAWPAHATYGDEEWVQLRWRPYWRLDQGQRWMDRFELGGHWWASIYEDPRFPTERHFDNWCNNLKDGYRGVIWSAPTDPLPGGGPTPGGHSVDGRLPEPALAVVVVSSTRGPRRTARWPLYLPDPQWPSDLRLHYAERRYSGERNWTLLTAELTALVSGAATEVQALAQLAWRARVDARRKRRR